MKLVILGATGGCGQWAVKVALERGHEVSAVVRPGSAFDSPVRVVRMDPLADPALPELLRAHDAVISCIGIRRKNLSNPWSRIASPRDLTARLGERLIGALSGTGKRLVVVSAGGVGDARVIHPVLRAVFATSSIGVAYRDLAKLEQRLRDSDLDWHSVKPVTLKDGPPAPYEEVERYGLSAMISRGSVGQALVELAEGARTFRSRTPMITERSTLAS
jgi:putative NADH-flavin reductase